MIDKLNTHYSFENPASVYDEEALTALELAGRQGAKINEVVEAQNRLAEDVEHEKSVVIPALVREDVQKHIKNGDFDRQIDEYTGNLAESVQATATELTQEVHATTAELEGRLNNLVKLSAGSTTGDAELMDARTGANGITYDNAGEGIREMDKIVASRVDAVSEVYGVRKIELTDLPIAHANKYIDNSGNIVDANGWNIRRYDVPEGVVTLSYEYGEKTAYGGVYYNSSGDMRSLQSNHCTYNVRGCYFLLNECLADRAFNVKNIVVRTYDSYKITRGSLHTPETMVHSRKYINNNIVADLVNCDIHRIDVKPGYDYYIIDYLSASVYGCIYDENNNFIGNISWDENDKIVLPDSASYMLFNLCAYADTGLGVVYEKAKGTATTETAEKVGLFTVLNKPYNFNGKKAVAFGDSITAGVTSPELKVTGNSYIKLFADKAGLTLTNRAISGSTLANYSIVEGATPICEMVRAENGTYDVIIIAGGTNDFNTGRTIGVYGSTDNTTVYGALEEICETLETNYPSAEVIFITPVNVTKYFPNAIAPLNLYRKAIQDVALAHGFSVVDGSTLGLPNEGGTASDVLIGNSDGCHPTELGHKIYANGLATVLL